LVVILEEDILIVFEKEFWNDHRVLFYLKN